VALNEIKLPGRVTNRISVGWAVPTVTYLVGTAHPTEMVNLFLPRS